MHTAAGRRAVRGELPTRPLLRVSSKSGRSAIEVTAFKPSEDGNAWIVRLFGNSDQDEEARIEWRGKELKRIWLSDNSEKPLHEMTGPIPVRAWTIVTLRVERNH